MNHSINPTPQLTVETIVLMQAELQDLKQTPNGWPRVSKTAQFSKRVILGGPEECWGWSGKFDRLGYTRIHNTNGTTYGHRMAYEFMVGPIPNGMELDHICRNRGCVNPAHLRVCTHSENLRNTGRMKTNKSGFKGVCWHKHERKWVATIMLNKKGKTIGYFNTPEEAHAAYCEAAWELFGEFANVGCTAHLDELDLRKAIPAGLVGGRGPKVHSSIKNPK